jgi:hypothetical protein
VEDSCVAEGAAGMVDEGGGDVAGSGKVKNSTSPLSGAWALSRALIFAGQEPPSCRLLGPAGAAGACGHDQAIGGVIIP